ncbi:MurR/RpiR family transcriptional regulator [Neomegalonema sp.]|uniref:MurR/RpiR family transcriptional regulator n=1 Tax=Neomegalonema sp. TaxID=2039713 RepID=UPI0026263F56|nr:MurR/RpiR family transcriptional regulator [Neomegalonema sp.]MDD2867425.1 MurR/RpiR family transcriptional regulator [Neomegalonema sp.]
MASPHSSPSPAPPADLEALQRRIAALAPDLPKRLRQCAEWALAHPDRVAVSTVAQLAAGAEAPPSAFVRFCQALGYAGFSDFQTIYREGYLWPDYGVRLEKLRARGDRSAPGLLAAFVEAGRDSLETLAKTLDPADLEEAAALLARARMIHVMGLRRAGPVALYLAYVFEKMEIPAMNHDLAGRLERRAALRPGDAALAISFAPYSEETVAFAEAAAARGLPVAVLTDTLASPLLAHARRALLVKEADVGAFRPLTATLSLASALAVAVGVKREAEIPEQKN